MSAERRTTAEGLDIFAALIPAFEKIFATSLTGADHVVVTAELLASPLTPKNPELVLYFAAGSGVTETIGGDPGTTWTTVEAEALRAVAPLPLLTVTVKVYVPAVRAPAATVGAAMASMAIILQLAVLDVAHVHKYANASEVPSGSLLEEASRIKLESYPTF